MCEQLADFNGNKASAKIGQDDNGDDSTGEVEDALVDECNHDIDNTISNYNKILKEVKKNRPVIQAFISQQVPEDDDESCVSSISQFQSFQIEKSLNFYSLKDPSEKLKDSVIFDADIFHSFKDCQIKSQIEECNLENS